SKLGEHRAQRLGPLQRWQPGVGSVVPIAAELDAAGFGRSERSLGAATDHAPLLRGDHGHHFDQHRFGIQAQLGDDDLHPAELPKAREMVHVTPEPVQLVHQKWTSKPPSLGPRSKEMRPVIVHAALNLNEVARYLKALGRSEALDRFL